MGDGIGVGGRAVDVGAGIGVGDGICVVEGVGIGIRIEEVCVGASVRACSNIACAVASIAATSVWMSLVLDSIAALASGLELDGFSQADMPSTSSIHPRTTRALCLILASITLPLVAV